MAGRWSRHSSNMQHAQLVADQQPAAGNLHCSNNGTMSRWVRHTATVNVSTAAFHSMPIHSGLVPCHVHSIKRPWVPPHNHAPRHHLDIMDPVSLGPVYWHRSACDGNDGLESNGLQINNKPYNAYALCVAVSSMQDFVCLCLCLSPKRKRIWAVKVKLGSAKIKAFGKTLFSLNIIALIAQ